MRYMRTLNYIIGIENAQVTTAHFRGEVNPKPPRDILPYGEFQLRRDSFVEGRSNNIIEFLI